MSQPSLDPRSDTRTRIIVWSIWAGMIALAVWYFAQYARNIPLADDWQLVAPLTGNEPHLGAWLWSQNNEHRVPLPRLVLLGVLRLTGGDFRSGMVLNIVLLALLAAAMMETARRLRGGTTRITDAAFPLLLLHVGDWQNLFWSWQLTFVLSVVLVCAALLAIVRHPALDHPGPAILAGSGLVLAPLCGGTGLAFLPPIFLWCAWRGVDLLRRRGSPAARRSALILLGSVGVTTAVVVLYFTGYQRPHWTPENPGLIPSLRTAIQFQTYGLGPGVRTSWTFWSVVSLVLLGAAAVRVVAGLRSQENRLRSAGLLVCLASVAGFAAAMGWGRASVLAVYGEWPNRYVLLGAPAFCMALFVWELAGHPRVNAWGRALLFAVAVLLLPLNTVFGREWGGDYDWGMSRLERDLAARIPRDALTERHRKFLIHWWDAPTLDQHIQMLRDRGMGPFSRLKTGVRSAPSGLPVDTLSLRYHLPHAGSVSLRWGVDGWKRVDSTLWSDGTTLTDRNVLSTPLHEQNGEFLATIRFPRGAKINYGYLVTGRADGTPLSGIWDGPRERLPGPGMSAAIDTSVVSLITDPLQPTDSTLVRQTIRYGPTDARRVLVIWGGDQWQPIPEASRPAGTRIEGAQMTTPMVASGNTFMVTLPIPAGRRLDFRFVVDRADRTGVVDNNNSANYAVTAAGDSLIRVTPALTLAQRSGLGTVLWTGGPLLALILIASGVGKAPSRDHSTS